MVGLRKVVVAGGGIGGMEAALKLKGLLGERVEVLVVDRNDLHVFTPILHEVATGRLRDEEAIFSSETVTARGGGRFLKSEITGISPNEKILETASGKVSYDYLVLSVGSVNNFFNIPGAEENCFKFKSYEDAVKIRDHVQKAFEEAAKGGRSEEADRALTFAVIGGGPNGVELASYLTEYARELSSKLHVDQGRARVVIIEALEHILPGFHPTTVEKTEASLVEKGVKLSLSSPVVRVEDGGVLLKGGVIVEAGTAIWTAGIKPHGLVKNLPSDKGGMLVDQHLRSVGYREIYGVGDDILYHQTDDGKKPVAKTAQNALEQGGVVARNIAAEILGGVGVEYKPKAKVAILSLGDGSALISYKQYAFRSNLVHQIDRFVARRYRWRRNNGRSVT